MQICCKKTPFLYKSKMLLPFPLQQAPFEMSTQDLDLRAPLYLYPFPHPWPSWTKLSDLREGCWIIGKFLSLLMIKEDTIHHSPLHSIQALLCWMKHKESKASLKGRRCFTKLCSVIFHWQALPAQGAWSRPCLSHANHPWLFPHLFSLSPPWAGFGFPFHKIPRRQTSPLLDGKYETDHGIGLFVFSFGFTSCWDSTSPTCGTDEVYLRIWIQNSAFLTLSESILPAILSAVAASHQALWNPHVSPVSPGDVGTCPLWPGHPVPASSYLTSPSGICLLLPSRAIILPYSTLSPRSQA